MATKSTEIRAAQILALFVASSTAGLSLGLSTTLIPRLLESPVPLMLRQWVHMVDVNKKLVPGLAGLAAAPYLYLAYVGAGAGRMYALAGALCLGIVPYTIAVVKPTNDKLFRKFEAAAESPLAVEAAELAASREESAKYLVDRWGVLNLGRSAMLAAAGLIGLVASL